MKITKNFDREEFTCKCGCGYDTINSNLVHRLQVIRDIIRVPIIILSGCRCQKHNKAVGGKVASLHLTADAADWVVEARNAHLHIMLQEMLSEWSGGFHYYPVGKGDFFHTDIGKRRRW